MYITPNLKRMLFLICSQEYIILLLDLLPNLNDMIFWYLKKIKKNIDCHITHISSVFLLSALIILFD